MGDTAYDSGARDEEPVRIALCHAAARRREAVILITKCIVNRHVMFSRDLIGKIQRQHFFVEKHMLPRSKPVAAPKRGLPSSSGAIRQPILHSDGSHPTRSAGDAGAGHSHRLASSPPSRPQLSCQTPSLGWLGSRFAWSKALPACIYKGDDARLMAACKTRHSHSCSLSQSSVGIPSSWTLRGEARSQLNSLHLLD
jgi:hypothetical protein